MKPTMIRAAMRAATLIAAAATLSACGSSSATSSGGQGRNTNSPISGTTLRCVGDYPDSRLVFAPDGTLSGRYAGSPVTGNWNAVAPDRVEVEMHAGAMSVREFATRTASGWRAATSACG